MYHGKIFNRNGVVPVDKSVNFGRRINLNDFKMTEQLAVLRLFWVNSPCWPQIAKEVR